LLIVSEDARQALLAATAVDVGRRLFDVRRDELTCEGRALVGGWPGTLREARALAANVLASVLTQRRLTMPTLAEVDWVVGAAYDEARRVWRESAGDKRSAPR
jgi:hypothetical protein